jgi:hypothetical protein
LKPNILSCMYSLKPKFHFILLYFVKLCFSSYSTFWNWKCIFPSFSLNPTTFHYEKSICWKHIILQLKFKKNSYTTIVQLSLGNVGY